MSETACRLWVIAHRGGAALGPENTLAAMRASVEAGADMLEVDVQNTSDGRLVICHDRLLERTSGVDLDVVDCTLPEVRVLDVGSHFGSEFEGERIPTLVEVLDWAHGRTRLLLDLRLESGHESQVIGEIVARRMEFDVVLGIHTVESLRAVRAICPSLRVVSLARSLWATQDMVDERVDLVRLWQEWATPDHIRRFHQMGVPVWVVTGGRSPETAGQATIEQLRALGSGGADGVILNDPRLAVALTEGQAVLAGCGASAATPAGSV